MRSTAVRRQQLHLFVVLVACALFATSVLLPRVAAAQGLTGALIGSVKVGQDAVIRGALVRVTSADKRFKGPVARS